VGSKEPWNNGAGPFLLPERTPQSSLCSGIAIAQIARQEHRDPDPVLVDIMPITSSHDAAKPLNMDFSPTP
jgi:hypothetical protein